MYSLGKVYLILYNVVMAAGWAYLAYQMVITSGDPLNLNGTLYPKIQLVLKIFQTGAILEVVHASIGLVKSNPVLTAFQVYSRVFVLWGIMNVFNAAQTGFGLPLSLMAWIPTEIVRYSFYAANILDVNVSIIVWLRYSMFIILYPIGITGELLCMYSSLPKILSSSTFSVAMPNYLNATFSFYYFVIITMFLYIPVFPQLYGHMLKQRKKVIGGENTSKKLE